MGGAKEATIGDVKAQKGGTIQSPSPATECESGLANINISDQKIRFHESKGEVHFHADGEKLKVAMPIADWFSMWNRLKTLQARECTYFDSNQGTLLTASAGLLGGKIDVAIKVTKVAEKSDFGDTYNALEKFTTR